MARLPAPQRRSQLLDTALEVFAETGFRGASMDEVAEAAGVTKPVLYQHFGSKRDLCAQLVGDVGDRLRDVVEKATRDAGSAKAQVHAGFRAYLRFVEENESAFRLLVGARQDPEFAAAVGAIEEVLADAVAGLIEADIDAEHRSLLGHAIVGLAEAAARHLLASGSPVDPDRDATRLADLAWAGLRGVQRV